MRPALALALALWVACVPGRHPVEGAACSLEHPCPDGLACPAGVCTSAADGGGSGGGGGGGGAGPDAGACHSSQVDGDFELGPVVIDVYWTPTGGVLTPESQVVHGGAWAARLSTPDGGTVTLRSLMGTASVTPGTDQCVEAWVRSEVGAGPLTLQLSRFVAGVTSLSPLPPEASVTADGGWQRLSNRWFFPSNGSGMAVELRGTLPAGAAWLIDDVCLQTCP